MKLKKQDNNIFYGKKHKDGHYWPPALTKFCFVIIFLYQTKL